MGIARAYKAPSLYQTNPNYLLYSKGGLLRQLRRRGLLHDG